MPKHGKQILAEALKLPPVERAELVENLLTSFEFQSRKKIDALWAQEVEDRIDAFERRKGGRSCRACLTMTRIGSKLGSCLDRHV